MDFVDISKPETPTAAIDGQFDLRPGEFYLTLLKRRSLFPDGMSSSNFPKLVSTLSNPRFYESIVHPKCLVDVSQRSNVIKFAKSGGNTSRRTKITDKVQLTLR